jgi:hypothetical protein
MAAGMYKPGQQWAQANEAGADKSRCIQISMNAGAHKQEWVQTSKSGPVRATGPE